MKARLTIIGNDVLGNLDPPEGPGLRLALTDENLNRLKNWADRYGRAVISKNHDALPIIGHEMFDWLDETGWASKWVRGEGDRILEVAVEDPDSPAGEAPARPALGTAGP